MLPTASLETLPNGLRLVLIPDDHTETVAFGLFVASGSRHETRKVAGISHFIEHMLFKGTATRSVRDITRAIEGRGGAFNAYTGEEVTCFYTALPCEFLPVAVDVISDMYRNAAISEAEFMRERQVVLQEIKMYADEPDSVASENLSLSLFPGNQVGAPIAGSEETLMPLKPADLRKYIKRAYVPKATVAVVAGSFDPADARALVQRYLGSLRGGEPLKAERFSNRTKVIPTVSASREINQVQLALGYRTSFGVLDKRAPVLSVFDAIMGKAMFSRLFEAVREKRGLSYDIRSTGQLFAETGAWCVTAGLDPKRKDQAYDAIMKEIERIRTKKVGPAELRRVKDLINGHSRMAFERTTSRLFYYGPSVLARGKIVNPAEAITKIEAVTSDDIIAFADELLQERNLAVSWVVPK